MISVYYLVGYYMRYMHKFLRVRLNRFLLVGAGNTALNFAVLNFAVSELHMNRVASVILATGSAIIFSFALNRSFVFRDSSGPVKKFARFSLIASVGMLLIQTSLYSISLYLLGQQGQVGNSIARVNISNLIASVGVMFWNYNGYRLIVFKDTKLNNEIADEASQETT